MRLAAKFVAWATVVVVVGVVGSMLLPRDASQGVQLAFGTAAALAGVAGWNIGGAFYDWRHRDK